MRARAYLWCGVLLAVAAGAYAQTPERMYVYRVDRIAAAEAPKLDGKLDEAIWKNRTTINSLRNFGGPPGLASQRSEVTLVSDGAWLYVGETFYDEDMANVRFNPAQEAFWNDCTELYFDPRHDLSRQIQLVVDCGGRRWWQKQNDDGWGWYTDTSFGVMADWNAAAQRYADRWTLEIAINCASFGINAAPGKACRFNVCRFRLNPAKAEFSAWTFGRSGAQKDMNAWGHLIFGAPGAGSGGGEITAADVKLIYPNLGKRVVQVPVPGGFVTYTSAGSQRQTYAQLLTPQIAQSRKYLDDAERVLAELPPTINGGEALRMQSALLRDTLDTAQDQVAGQMELNDYDKLATALDKARSDSEIVYWKARLLTLTAA